MRGLAPSCTRRRVLSENVSDAANGRGLGGLGGTPERVKGSALARPNAVWYTVTIPNVANAPSGFKLGGSPMTVAPLIAMKSSQVKSFDAVGRELDRRAHTYANDVDQSGRHIGYRCRAEDERPMPLEKAVERRMGELKTKRKVRENQVRAMGFIVSSNDALGEKSAREFLDRSINWFGARYGYENLLAAQIHLDEGTPHAHIWVAPVIHDAETGFDRLCAKELFAPDKRRKNAEGKWEVTAQGTMSRLQEDFWEQVAKPYGYERPLRREQRAEGYRSLEAYKVHVGTTRALKADLTALEERRDEKAEEVARMDSEVSGARAELDAVRADIQRESARLESLRRGTRAVERDVEELRPIAAEVRRWEDAGRAERGTILDSIAARCAGAARAIGRAVEELGDRIWALMRPRKAQGGGYGLDEMVRYATETAKALDRSHEAPARSRGQAR